MSSEPLSPTSAKPSARMGLGCNLLLWVGFGLFLGFMLTASIEQVNRGLTGIIHCPGAKEIVFDDYESDTSQQRSNGTTRTISGSVFTMICTMSDDSIKTVSNDTAVLTGFVAGSVIGALIGLFIALIMTLRERGSSMLAKT